jgi:RNase P protein component
MEKGEEMNQEKKKSSLWHDGLLTELSKDWTDEQRKSYGGTMISHEEAMTEILQSAGISKFRIWLSNHFITRLIERRRIKRLVKESIRNKRNESQNNTVY